MYIDYNIIQDIILPILNRKHYCVRHKIRDVSRGLVTPGNNIILSYTKFVRPEFRIILYYYLHYSASRSRLKTMRARNNTIIKVCVDLCVRVVVFSQHIPRKQLS